MITISGDPKLLKSCVVTVGGVVCTPKQVHLSRSGGNWVARLLTQDVVELALNMDIVSFPPDAIIHLPARRVGDRVQVRQSVRYIMPHCSPHVRCQVWVDAVNWSRRFTVAEYISHVYRRFTSEPQAEVWRTFGYMAGEIHVDLYPSCGDGIGPVISSVIESAKRYDVSADATLATKSENFLLTAFEFPEPVRSVCEQYLVYFAEFLRTMGVSAETSLQNKAGKVLFSVIPANKAVALGAIQEALCHYLNLPNAHGAGAEFFRDNPHALSLLAQVEHFKSQLNFANAVIATQNIALRSVDGGPLPASVFQPSIIFESLRPADDAGVSGLGLQSAVAQAAIAANRPS